MHTYLHRQFLELDVFGVKMKVMIFVCGEGLGHTSRCISIGRELVRAGHDVHFGAYGYSRELIDHKGFVTHEVPPEITLVGKAGSLNMKKSILATFKRGGVPWPDKDPQAVQEKQT